MLHIKYSSKPKCDMDAPAAAGGQAEGEKNVGVSEDLKSRLGSSADTPLLALLEKLGSC